ncbi:MAG: pyridoxamine 5'-phosphate oxidase family protein [Candidatus Heimdallarchaeota archaeon]
MSNINLDNKEDILKLRKEPDFAKIKGEILAILEKNRNVTLATSLDNRVTARTVQYVSIDLDIYFTSWGFNKKIVQIKGNSSVALYLKNLQIEGSANILG